VHRPGGLLSKERFSGADDTPPKAACCVPAPPVLEFDPSGKLLKFAHDGKFIAQFGNAGMTGGNHDTKNLAMPANLTVDDAVNEV
jgi:hypothetical protein